MIYPEISDMFVAMTKESAAKALQAYHMSQDPSNTPNKDTASNPNYRLGELTDKKPSFLPIAEAYGKTTTYE